MKPALAAAWVCVGVMGFRPAARADSVRRIYVRAGVAHVAPFATSSELELSGVQGPSSLAVSNGPVAGSGAAVSSATIPAITVGYRLALLHNRLALETVLGLPFAVTFMATGSLATDSLAPMALGIPTGVPALGPALGEAKAVPAMLTAVYDLRAAGRLMPYAGGGLAVLFARGATITNPILTEVRQPGFRIPPTPGLVLQAGLEARLTRRWYARIDAKFIALMVVRVEVDNIEIRTPELPLFGTVDVGDASMNVTLNPLIIQASIGADF